MKLIDEATLFNATDEEVWHAIDDEHMERSLSLIHISEPTRPY